MLGWLSVCCLGVVVPVSALLVWTDPHAPHSLGGRLLAVWRTSAETLRLGAVGGAPLRMLLSALLGLIALLCVSTLVGVITTGLGDRLSDLRRGRSTVLERGHAVVLGWSEQVCTVVGELLAARERGVVAVLADRDSEDTESRLVAALGPGARARLVCRSGAPADPEALKLLTPAAARSVVVLPADGADADLHVVRTLLALRAVLGADAGPPVVAAVRDERLLPTARLAAGAHGTVLETEATTARLLLQAARRPGLPAALRDLLDFAGAEFHLIDAPAPDGADFGDLALRYDASCVAGVLRADGTFLLTPAPDTPVGTGDRLLVVAHDDTAEPPADFREHVDPTCVAVPVAVPETPLRVLLLGWNRRAPLLVDGLRGSAPPGSVLDVVTGAEGGLVPSQPGPPPDTAACRPAFHPGDLLHPATLDACDPFTYDSVIVLGPEPGPGAERPDDRTLAVLLALRAREEAAGRALPVVAELSDRRSRPLAPLGPAADAVVRGELTALLMAQLSHTPALAPVFEAVFGARGGALDLRPAGQYVRPGSLTSFATVAAAALARGECAIGYRAHGVRAVRRDEGIRLCPRKTDRRVWGEGDEILVLAAAPAPHGGPAPGPPAARQESAVRREQWGDGSSAAAAP
ncbi:NAD-binding lipoprotein [Streptomyces sp. J2-1]|nr:NAD-binding lipoprotein [Streptomyces corallincola]